MDPPAQKLLQELELKHWFSGHQACVCHLYLGICCVWMVVFVWCHRGFWACRAPGLAAWYNTVWHDYSGIKALLKDCFHIVTALLKGPKQHLRVPFHWVIIYGCYLIRILLSVHRSFVHWFLWAYRKWDARSASVFWRTEGKVARMGQPEAHLYVGKRTACLGQFRLWT